MKEGKLPEGWEWKRLGDITPKFINGGTPSTAIPEYWDGVMQKIAFTIFEIAKQTISNGSPQEEVLQIVEHHVKKAYQAALEELKENELIDESAFERAAHQSNIDEMMQQAQEEQAQMAGQGGGPESGTNYQENSKILKLASVALLLKQVSQDKVQTILNKFKARISQFISKFIPSKLVFLWNIITNNMPNAVPF